MWNKTWKVGFNAVLLLSLLIALSVSTNLVSADVPTILDIKRTYSETSTIMEVSISHQNPSTTHYIDTLEVATSEFDCGRWTPWEYEDLELNPQTTETFTVDYEMGEVTIQMKIIARAHCNTHGWSDYTQEYNIPASMIRPVVASVINSTSGTNIIFTITFDHTVSLNDCYVDAVKVESKDRTLSTTFEFDPIYEKISTVEVEFGAIEGYHLLEAFAHCQNHGWGPGSSAPVPRGIGEYIEVPEFQLVPTVLLFVVLTLSIVSIKLFVRKEH